MKKKEICVFVISLFICLQVSKYLFQIQFLSYTWIICAESI